MRIHLLPSITFAIGLVAAGAAFAQSPKDQPGADQAKPAQAGTQEPGSQAPTAHPDQSPVLVDGKLNVPGAPDSDMVPAKFSAKNNADDQLITLGYTFKELTPEQKRAIYQVVSSAGAAKTASDLAKDLAANDLPAKVAEVGATLPPLHPVLPFPDQTTAQVGQVAKYRYALVGDKLILVEPNSMIVVGVIGPEAAK